MTDEEHEEILRIVRQIQNSPVMNGDFLKLTKSVEHIRTTQGQMCTDMSVVISKQKEARGKIDDLYEAMYNPDKGIYKRISDTASADDSQNNQIKSLEEKQTELESAVDGHGTALHTVESTQDDLRKVAGERMEHLDSVVKTHKNTRRLVWAGLIGLIGFAIKTIAGFML